MTGASYEAISHEDVLVHEWRVPRLIGLGSQGRWPRASPRQAGWHQVANLVQHGCPARLALQIVR